MKIQDVMTRYVEVIHLESNLKEAAEKMRSLDVGAIPVCEGDRMVGMLTDRDITVRATAEGRDPHRTLVRDVMTKDVVACRPNDDIRDAARLMEQKQIRRLAICDDQQRLIGIVSLGDLAVGTGDSKMSGKVLEKVSEPAVPRRAA